MSKGLTVITFLVLLFLLSCTKGAKEEILTNNDSFKVELLFEVEGCKVYRFIDGGRNRYFTNCQGAVSWAEKQGKNNTMDMEVTTNRIMK